MKGERTWCQIHEREAIAIVAFTIIRRDGRGSYVLPLGACEYCFALDARDYFAQRIKATAEGETNANPRRG
jgi:hypothetical protein